MAFVGSASLRAATPLTLQYRDFGTVGNPNVYTTRRAPVNNDRMRLQFDLTDGANPYESSLDNSFFNIKIYNSSNVLIYERGGVNDSHFTVSGISSGNIYAGGSTSPRGGIIIRPNLGASVGSDYRVEIDGANVGYTLSATSTNNGSLSAHNNGLFSVEYSPLHIEYTSAGYDPASESFLKQGNATKAYYNFKVYYPNGSELASGGGNFQVKVYKDCPTTCTDVSSDFSIGTPIYNGSHWTASVLAGANAPFSSTANLTLGISWGTENSTDTLNTDFSFKAIGPTSGNNIIPASPYTGKFKVLPGNPSITFLSRSKATIGKGDPAGTVYKWRGKLENGTTPVTGSEIGANEWRILIYNSANTVVYDSENVPSPSPFTISNPVYNSSVDTWEVSISATVDSAFGTGYYLGIDTISAGPASGLEMLAAEISTDSDTLDSTAGSFEVGDSSLKMLFHSRDTDTISKSSGDLSFYYSLQYLDNTEFTLGSESSNLNFKIYDNAAADVSAHFTLTNSGYGSWGAASCGGESSCWKLTVQAKSSASTVSVLSQGYYFSVEKTAANKGASRTILTETDSSGAASSSGRFKVAPTTLHIEYLAPATATSVKRGMNDAAVYRFRVYYPGGSSQESSDTGYQVRIYKTVDNSLVENISSPETAYTGTVFNATALSYATGAWEIGLMPRSGANPEDYYISVQKTAGTKGDTFAEFSSNSPSTADPNGNKGLGSNGNISVTGADLKIVYDSLSANSLSRETSGSQIQFAFRAYYPDGDEINSGASTYSYKVCRAATDCSTTNYNSHFNEVSAITYNAGKYVFTLSATKTAPAENDYYVIVSKTSSASSPDTLTGYASNASTTADTNGNIGLDSSGVFNVNNVVLNVVFRRREMLKYADHIKRGDQIGVDYYYSVKYPNGTAVLDDDNDHIIQVHSSSGLVESSTTASPTKFVFGAVNYVTAPQCAPDPSCWKVKIKANNAAAIGNGYRLAVEKTGGSSGDTFLSTFSSVPTQLGGTNGIFEIRNGVLYIVYNSLNQNTVRKGDNVPIIYKYSIFKPGEPNQTANTNFSVGVYNSSGNPVSSGFTMSTPVYNASDCGGSGCWSVQITPPASFAGTDTYHLGVSKPLSGDGALPLADSRSTLDNNTPVYTARGLNDPATSPSNEGTFTVIPEIVAVWQSRANAAIERGTSVRYGNLLYGATYRFLAQTPDGSFSDTSDHGYIIKLYNDAGTLVETWNINTPGYPKDILSGTNFNLERFRHDGTSWIFGVRPKPTAPIGTGYYVSVEKQAGSTPNTVPTAVTSKEGSNLNASTGTFEVTGATLNFLAGANQIMYNPANEGTVYQRKIENYDASSTLRFRYRVRYDDNTEETTGPHEVSIIDSTNTDVSSKFNIGTPSWDGSFWNVNITPKLSNKPLAGTGYRVGVRKSSGVDTLAQSYSQSSFEVTDSSVSIVALTAPLTSPNNMPRNDATGVDLYYRLLIDGNSGTEDTLSTEAAHHLFRFYSGNTLIDTRQGGDTGSEVFKVTLPAYSSYAQCGGGSCWKVNIKAGDEAPVSNTLGDFIYHVRLAKNGGSHLALETRSNVAPQGLAGVSGQFEVTGSTWQLRYTGTSRDTWSAGNQGVNDRCALLDRCFPRNAADGIVYYFQVYRGNGTIHVGDDTANIGLYQVRVYDDSNADVSSKFTISPITYNGTAHQVRLTPNSSDDDFWSKYKIGIRRNGTNAITYNGPNSDVLSTITRVNATPFVPHSGLNRNVPGYNTGTFSVSDLHVSFSGRSVASTQRTEPDGIDYTFTIKNSGSNTAYTTDIPASNIQVWNGGSNRTGWFTVSDAVYSGGVHKVKIRARTTTPIQNGFYVRVGVNAAPTGSSDVAFYTPSNAVVAAGGLGASNGVFSVQPAQLTVKYIKDSKPGKNRLERFNASDSITFYWRLFYPDNTSQLANTGSGQSVSFVDASNAVVPDCTVSNPTWNGTESAWASTVQCGNSATLAETHRLRIQKSAGSDGNLVSTSAFSDASVSANAWEGGLGSGYETGGAVAIRPATFNVVWYYGPNQAVLEQADDASARYTFSLFYPDQLNTLYNSGDKTGMKIDVRKVSDNSIVETFNSFPSTGSQFRVSNITNTAGPDYQYNVYVYALKDTDIGDYYISLSKNSASTTLDNVSDAADASLTRRRFGVSNATLNLVSNSLSNKDDTNTRTITRGNDTSKSIVYSFSVRYDINTPDIAGEERNIDASNYSVRIIQNSVNQDRTANFDITPASGIQWDASTNKWKVEIAARPDTPITTGIDYYKVEISKNTGGTSGDTLTPSLSDSDLLANGRFKVTYAPLSISFLPVVNATMERKDQTSNLTEYPFEVLYPNPLYKLNNANVGTLPLSVEIWQGSNDRSSWFYGINASDGQTVSPIVSWDATNSRWRIRVRAKSIVDGTGTSYARLANDYFARISRGSPASPSSDYIPGTNAARNSNDAANLSGAGNFTVSKANMYIQYTLRERASIRRADGVGTNFFFRLFYPDGSEFSSATSADNLGLTIYKDSDNSLSTEFTKPTTPTYGTHGSANCGGAGSCFQWNVKSNDNTEAADYYAVIEKTSGGAGREDVMNASYSGLTDTPYKSKSVNETVSNRDFQGLGTNGVFATTFENNLSLAYLAKSKDQTRRNEATGITYRYEVHYADTTTEEINDKDYVLNVHRSSGAIVATKTGDGTSYTMTLGASNWDISDPVYSATDKWSVTIKAKAAAIVEQDYYISISKNGVIDKITTPVKSQNDPTGALTDGNFDVTNLRIDLSSLNLSNASMEQRASDTQRTRYTFQVFNNADTTPLTNVTTPSVDPAQFSVKVYKTGTPDLDVTSQFESISVNRTGNDYYFDLRALHTSVVGDDFFVEINYDSWGSGNVLSTYTTKSNHEFEVTEATLRIAYLNRLVDEIEKGDVIGTKYYYRIFYDDNTQFEPSLDSYDNEGLSYKVYDNTGNDITSSGFVLKTSSPSYSAHGAAACNDANPCWEAIVMAGIGVDAGNDRYFMVTKNNTDGNKDSLSETFSSKDTGPDSFGSTGLGATNGSFTVNNAILRIEYASRLPEQSEKGNTVGVTYKFRLYYKNNAEFTSTDGESSLAVKLFDSSNVMRSTASNSYLADNSPAFTYSATDGWTVTLKTSLNAISGTGYYVKINKTAGASYSELNPYSSKATTTPSTDPNTPGSLGLGGSDGVFEITPGRLYVRYSALSNASRAVQRKESALAQAITVNFNVYYKNNTEESVNANKSDYALRILDASNNDVSNKFDFYNWGASKFESAGTHDAHTAFSGDHLRYDSGSTRWQVAFRPRRDAAVGTGYKVSIERSTSNSPSHPSYQMADYINPAVLSNASTTADAIGNIGLGTLGTFEVTGANLTVKYLDTSFDISNATTENKFERADGTGITYKLRFFYPDGLARDNWNASMDGFTNAIYPLAQTSAATGFNTDSLAYNATDNLWELKVLADDTAGYTVNYRLGIEKAGGADGDIIQTSNRAYSDAATGTAVSGGLDAGISTGGQFDVLPATLNIRYIQRNNSIAERGDNRDDSPEYTFRVFYDDVNVKASESDATQEINDTGYTLKVYDSTDSLVESFNLSSSDQIGSNGKFAVSGLVYDSDRYRVRIMPRKTTAIEAGYYITISKSAGGEGDTVLPVSSKLQDNGSDSPTGTYHKGLAAGAVESAAIFEVKSATLNIKFAQRTPASIERADTQEVVYRYKLAYDNAQDSNTALHEYLVNTEENASNLSATVYKKSDNTDVSSLFNGITTAWNAAQNAWETSIEAAYTTPEDEYYLRLAKSATGTSNTTFTSFNSNMTSSAAPDFHIGLGTGLTDLTQGEFRVTPATLSVVFNSLAPATKTVKKLEMNVAKGIVYRWKVKYKNAVEETSTADKASYTVKVMNGTDNVTTTMQFFDWGTGNYETTGGFASRNLRYNSGYWEVRLRPGMPALVKNGYYLVLSRTSDSNVPDTLPEYKSNAGTTPVNGNVGLASNGEYEVQGAELFVKYHSTSFSSVPLANRFERQNGIGIQYYYSLHYNDGAHYPMKSNTTGGTVDGFAVTLRDKANASVNADFAATEIQYGNYGATQCGGTLTACWRVNIKAVTGTPVANGYRVGLTKAAGSDGDTVTDEVKSSDAIVTSYNGGLGPDAVNHNTNGEFEVLPANLKIIWLARASANGDSFVERGTASAKSMRYRYRLMYPDMVTEATDSNTTAANYQVKILDGSDTNVSGYFTASTPSYDASSKWTISLQAKVKNATGTLTPIANDYSVSVSKSSVSGDKDILGDFSARKDPSATGNSGLGTGLGTSPDKGEFEVRNASLHIVYQSRSKAALQRGTPSEGTSYRFKVYYPDGTEITPSEETDSTSFEVIMRNSSVDDRSADFSHSSPPVAVVYDNDAYKVDFFALKNATINPGYYIDISKTNGNTGDTLATYSSNASKTANANGNAGLAAGLAVDEGEFEVQGAALKVKYVKTNFDDTSADNVFERQDGNGVTYFFKLFYEDGTVKTDSSVSASDIQVRLLNNTGNSDANTTTNFTIGTTTYNSTTKTWEVSIKASKKATLADGYRISVHKLAGADGDFITLANAKLSNEVIGTTIDGALGTGISGGEFKVDPATLRIVYVSRSNDSASPTTSAVYRGTNENQRMNYNFRLLYPDNTTQALSDDIDAANLNIAIERNTTDESSRFQIATPAYDASLDSGNGAWNVKVKASHTASVHNDYALKISKTAVPVSDPEELLAYRSDAATTAVNGNIGLGTSAGKFEVRYAALIAEFTKRSDDSRIEKESSPLSRIEYRFKVYYPDGTPEETGSYTAKIFLSSNNADESANFNIDTPTFDTGTGEWMFLADALSGARLSENLYTQVSRSGSGQDTLSAVSSHEKDATCTTPQTMNCSQGLGAGLQVGQGEFEVVDYVLRIEYIAVSEAKVQRTLSTTYYYQIWNYKKAKDDGSISSAAIEDDNAGLQWITVKDMNDKPVAWTGDSFTPSEAPSDQMFSITGPTYSAHTQCGGASCWALTIKSDKNTKMDTGYYITIQRENVAMGSLARMKEISSKVVVNAPAAPDFNTNSGLGPVNGVFEVEPGVLKPRIISRSEPVIARHDGVGTIYYYSLVYPDGISKDVNASESNFHTFKVLYGNTPTLNASESNNFQTSPAQLVNDAALCGGDSACWKTNVKALAAAQLMSDYSLAIEKGDGSSTFDHTSSQYTIFTDPLAPIANYQFEVVKANLIAQFTSISPLVVSMGDTIRFNVRLGYADGTGVNGTLFTNALHPSNLRILRVESRKNPGAEVSDKEQFEIENSVPCDANGNCVFTAKVVGSNVSKVGDYLDLSGVAANGDTLARKDSISDLGNNGVFTVGTGIKLYQNFPNPFNPAVGERTEIRFDLVGHNDSVILNIYTVSGELVRSFGPGDIINRQRVFWDGKNDSGLMVASGVYYLVLKAGSYQKSIKIAVIK